MCSYSNCTKRAESLSRNCPCMNKTTQPKASPLPLWQPVRNDWLLQGHVDSALLLWFGTILQGHPSSSVLWGSAEASGATTPSSNFYLCPVLLPKFTQLMHTKLHLRVCSLGIPTYCSPPCWVMLTNAYISMQPLAKECILWEISNQKNWSITLVNRIINCSSINNWFNRILALKLWC